MKLPQSSEDHGNGDAVLSDEAVDVKSDPIIEDEIEFHEGWIPTHYE